MAEIKLDGNIELHKILPPKVATAMLFSTQQRLALYEMLAALIAGGIPVDVCLRRLKERKEKMKRPDTFIIEKWQRRMDEGDEFADAIRDEVPPQERVLIAAGAAGDNLAEGLAAAIKATNGVKEITGTIRKGLAQPALLMAALFVLLIGFSSSLAPEFAKMLPESRWEGYSGALLKVARIIEKGWPFFIAAVVGVVGLFVWSLPNWTGDLRAKLDRYPPYSIYRSYSAATFLIALSSLLRSGQPLDAAIKKIRTNAPPWLAQHLSRMLRKMDLGTSIGEALDTGLIDDSTTDQLYIYSSSPKFSEALKNIGETAITQGIATITVQAYVAKMVAMVCIGSMVSWIQLSLFDLQAKAAQADTVQMQRK